MAVELRDTLGRKYYLTASRLTQAARHKGHAYRYALRLSELAIGYCGLVDLDALIHARWRPWCVVRVALEQREIGCATFSKSTFQTILKAAGIKNA